MRKIRKVVSYACTVCYALFPTAKSAREHAEKHTDKPRQRRTYRNRPTQTSRILEAIRNGASDAQAISAKTKIPLTRVHSLLSYHRRKGNVRGYKGRLRAVE